MNQTPVQKLMDYMGKAQYFIGNDLLVKAAELIKEEKELIKKLRKNKKLNHENGN